MLKRTLLFLAGTSLLAAADYLPLETGNAWTYRTATGAGFTITVGSTAVVDGTSYYWLTGYTAEPVLVRTGDDGTLYARAAQGKQELPLTVFGNGESFDAPFRQCAEQGTVEISKAPYQGPAGRFASPLVIAYRILNCADAGTTEEIFAGNIGMLRRTETTIAGPRVFDLVSARIGGVTIAARPSASFRVAVSSVEQDRLAVALHLATTGAPIALEFPTGQRYDFVLRDANGKVLSALKDVVFPQVVSKILVAGEYIQDVEVPLAAPLASGTYTLEAWLTATPRFAATVAFEIRAGSFSARPDCCRAPLPPRRGDVR